MHANQVLKRWKIRKKGSTTWRQVDLPGCWEALGYPMDDPGPYQYATRRMIPRTWNAGRTWLRFGAVSYLCRVWVNGQEVGTHTGMWDAFEYEITPYVQAGQVVEILVEVEKPASLVNGPDSAHVSGGYPLRKTLSGFLPYVWGHALGGVWQAVKLVYDDEPRVKDVAVSGMADGKVTVLIELDRPGELALEIRDAEDSLLRIAKVNQAENLATYSFVLPQPQAWGPDSPYRYSLVINHTQRFYFGLRSLAVTGQTLLLNGRPLYPRLALSWGRY